MRQDSLAPDKADIGHRMPTLRQDVAVSLGPSRDRSHDGIGENPAETEAAIEKAGH
jgi:hypothetical protein